MTPSSSFKALDESPSSGKKTPDIFKKMLYLVAGYSSNGQKLACQLKGPWYLIARDQDLHCRGAGPGTDYWIVDITITYIYMLKFAVTVYIINL